MCRHGVHQLVDRRVGADSLHTAQRAFAAVTPATRPASVTEPTAAASPAPTANTGVSGFASSPATARANKTGGDPYGRQLRVATRRFGDREPRPRGAECTERGVRRHGVPGDFRCTGTGAGRRPSDDPATVPVTWAASAATFTGTAARRDALEAGPRKDHAAPMAEPAAERATLRVLTSTAPPARIRPRGVLRRDQDVSAKRHPRAGGDRDRRHQPRHQPPRSAACAGLPDTRSTP